MDPQKWKRFKRLVMKTLDQERTKWPSFLAAQCGEDVDLFLDASAMLAISRSMGDFIEAPACRALSAAHAALGRGNRQAEPDLRGGGVEG